MQTTNFHSCFVRVFAVEAFSQVSFKFLSLLRRGKGFKNAKNVL